VIEALAKVCKDHHAELASTLIQIFCHYNRVVPITTACIAKSIESEGGWDALGNTYTGGRSKYPRSICMQGNTCSPQLCHTTISSPLL